MQVINASMNFSGGGGEEAPDIGINFLFCAVCYGCAPAPITEKDTGKFLKHLKKKIISPGKQSQILQTSDSGV